MRTHQMSAAGDRSVGFGAPGAGSYLLPFPKWYWADEAANTHTQPDPSSNSNALRPNRVCVTGQSMIEEDVRQRHPIPVAQPEGNAALTGGRSCVGYSPPTYSPKT